MKTALAKKVLTLLMKLTSMFLSMSHTHKLLVSSLTVALFIVILLPSEQASASRNSAEAAMVYDSSSPAPEPSRSPRKATELRGLDNKLQLGIAYPLPLPYSDSDNKQNSITPQKLTHTTIKIKSGDSLSRIFSRAGFSAKTLYQIDNSGDEARLLRKIMPGKLIHFYSNDAGELMKLTYSPNKRQRLNVEKDTDTQTYTPSLISSDVEIRHQFARAQISSNFWNAGNSAQLSDSLIMELASIFGWDVDFALDIRAGDSFAVLYEQKYVDGNFIGNGDIIAAEFTNQGELFQAVRHSDGHYYTPNGNSMRKTFLRAPVNFKYISSNFNPRRLHPVTGKVRAHRGIDYAARVGTPIMAAGDGKVIASGYNKYNGNYIFIKHSERYVTKYLHMQKRYVKKNQKVKQGKTIGTLGGTGRVTGPHLHYEFLVNGVHKNPRTVKLPQSKPIKSTEREAFMATAKKWMTQLQDNNRVMLALVPANNTATTVNN